MSFKQLINETLKKLNLKEDLEKIKKKVFMKIYHFYYGTILFNLYKFIAKVKGYKRLFIYLVKININKWYSIIIQKILRIIAIIEYKYNTYMGIEKKYNVRRLEGELNKGGKLKNIGNKDLNKLKDGEYYYLFINKIKTMYKKVTVKDGKVIL